MPDKQPRNQSLESKAIPATPEPLVSIVIACRNVAQYIDDALWSARRQSLSDIEILVVDDGSVDDTPLRIKDHALLDPRIRSFGGAGTGPAAARNIALKAAQGTWVAILDGDDIMHPRRLEWLLANKAAEHADIVADNLVQFYEDGSVSRPLIEGDAWQAQRLIDLPTYIRANTMFGKGPPLGYLKPLIRRDMLDRNILVYDETLRIGEDYDLIARLLLIGARMLYLPGACYFYRRHSASISFRLGTAEITRLIDAADHFRQALPMTASAARLATDERRQKLILARHFAELVASLKARHIGAALHRMITVPDTLPLLLRAAIDGLGRRLRSTSGHAVAKTASTLAKSYVMLWRGDASSAAPVTVWLQQHGWQGNLYLCSDAPGNLATVPTLPEIAEFNPTQGTSLLLCDDPRLVDFFPYLLAPHAKTALVMAANAARADTARLDVDEASQPFDLHLVLQNDAIVNAADMETALLA